MTVPQVYVGPVAEPAAVEAVRRGGGEVVASPREATAIAWLDWRPEHRPALVAALHPGIAWVQLPTAGIESWLADGVIDDARTWTNASHAFAPAVAEHALALTLAGCRRLAQAARARTWDEAIQGTTLRGATVAVVGAGAIGRALIAMLAPLGAEAIAVTRRGRPVDGARETVAAGALASVWPRADVVVLCAPATAQTRRLVGAEALAAMRDHAWLVNVGRGALVDTDALVRALDAGRIAGAALDVVDPEPLPDGHPLWTHPRALLTPHVASPRAVEAATLAELIGENVARLAAGREPLGVIDPARGY
ncbi:MAG: hydroxyacid dehydrogenase [Solirubrobacteraceae bacterium]|nr:hydroxyacid dehydrogenase [Solirubrobacteraceae bacterium]